MRLHLVFAAAALVACGAPARSAQTTVTAAEVSDPPPPPPAEPRQAEPEAKPESPPGELACRTKTDTGESAELWLEWQGNEGKGTVVTVASSGMVYRQRVEAERNEKVIVADDPNVVDLVKHAAMIAKKDGKQYMRVGDSPWRLCE